MTVLPEMVDAWVALMGNALPGVQIAGEPLGESVKPAAVYLEEYVSDFEWRSLGNNAKNRRESLRLLMCAQSYQERHSQHGAAKAARRRVLELCTAIERAIVVEPTPFQVGGTVSFARIARWRVTFAPVEKGWVAVARATLEAEHYPA